MFMVWNILSPSKHTRFFTSLEMQDSDASQVILDQVDWTDEASARLESLIGSNAAAICLDVSDNSTQL